MAVMQKLRDNMTYILFFLLIMFVASMTVGGLVGGANILDTFSGRKPDTILVVNDQQISFDQYSRVRQGQMEQYRQQNGQEPTGYQRNQLEDQIWEGIIVDVLKQQTVDELGLTVTPAEIRYLSIENPHPIYTMDPNFMNENKEFDPAKFRAAQANADPQIERYWQYKEQQLRTFIPYEKLENEIKATVRVTNAELKEEYKKRNVKVKAKYVVFENSKYVIPDDQISDSEITAYYNQHKEDYKEEEQRRIRYVLFPTTPTAEDSADVRALAQTLLDSAKAGADFADLAELHSEDPGSAENGGDLGFFPKGQMVKPFEDAAFAAKKGEVVGPVETVHGLHIIKVEDRKRENKEDKVKARHILLKFNASRETQDTARELADYFADEAPHQGFSVLAQNENIKTDTTTYFRNAGFVPGLGMQKQIVMKAFHVKPGEPSRVYHIENRGYVVFEVIDIKEERIQPLADVRARVVSQLRTDKQLELAKAAAEAVHPKMTSPDVFETVATAESLTVKETDFITINGYVAGIGRDPGFNGAAFQLDVNEISTPVKGTRGYYIIMVTEKQDFDEKAFTAGKDNLKNELMQTKLRMVYSDWLAAMKDNSEIEDFRYVFY